MKLRMFTILVVALTQIAAAERYRVIDLGPLQPVGINASGEIAGNYNNRAYLRTAWGAVVDLGKMPGGTFTLAAGINDLGAVAGTADGAPATIFEAGDPTKTATCSNMTQPFLWTARKGLTTATGTGFSVPNEIWVDDTSHQYSCAHAVYASGLNNSDQVVASNVEPLDLYLQGFLWDSHHGISGVDGGDVPGPGFWGVAASAINDQGTYVGEWMLSGLTAATVTKDGVGTDLFGLQGLYTHTGANSINRQGTVAGWSAIQNNPSVIHGVLWENGMIKDLGTLPGDLYSMAIRISPTGVVIGTSGNTEARGSIFFFKLEVVGRPFVWSHQRGMEDLNELIDRHLGWVLNTVADINAWGQIVGTGTHDGKTHGFLLTPER
jgi:probable HAF family extracellular repeat protein